MGLIVLDTSALAAYLDAGDALHVSAEAALLAAATDRHRFAVSMVTWAELMVGVELGHYPREAIGGFFHDMGIARVPVDEAIAEHGARLRAKFRLKLPDALVLATADLAKDGEAVISGDRAWGKVAGLGVELIALTA